MITSKPLNLSEEDILKETNLETLFNWKSEINSYKNSILIKFNVDSWKDLPPKVAMNYRFHDTLERIVRSRIGYYKEIAKQNSGEYRSERSRRKDRTLQAKFMEVAKRILNKEDYKQILNIAQSELGMEENLIEEL